MPSEIRAVLYARVSSDRQEQEETIQSQLAELRAHLSEAGLVDWQEFTDEGYARDDLRRPSLDRLRDLVAEGGGTACTSKHRTGWPAVPSSSSWWKSSSKKVWPLISLRAQLRPPLRASFFSTCKGPLLNTKGRK